MKVVLRAPLLTNSGYGVHSRQIFEWLRDRSDVDLYTECVRWGNCSWIVDPDAHGGLIREVMKHSKPVEKGQKLDYSFQVQLPNEWDTNLARKNIGISAFVETDRCNPEWVNHCNKMDKIVTPSTFTKNVVLRSGKLTTDIEVIPEWYNHNIIKKSDCDKISNNDDRYNFKTPFNIMIMGLLRLNVLVQFRNLIINL